MHVPDGFINAPVSAATGLISLGTIWAYIRNAKNLVADRLIAVSYTHLTLPTNLRV